VASKGPLDSGYAVVDKVRIEGSHSTLGQVDRVSTVQSHAAGA
jgi:hypothetical protein